MRCLDYNPEMSSKFQFKNDGLLEIEETECDCYQFYSRGDTYECKCIIDLDLKINGDYVATVEDDEIDDLQKFLMDFWYELEKRKRDN